MHQCTTIVRFNSYKLFQDFGVASSMYPGRAVFFSSRPLHVIPFVTIWFSKDSYNVE